MDHDEHESDVERWRQRRIESLLRPRGWLSLAGLSWLHSGANRIGSDRSNELPLPSGPEVAGTLVLSHGVVTVEAAGQQLTQGGQSAGGIRMVADEDAADDEEPTLLELGSLQMCLIRRGARIGLRTWDTDAPGLRRFAGIPHFAVDIGWRLEAQLEPGTGGRVDVPDVLGDVAEEVSPGTVAFAVDHVTHRLQTLQGGDDGELWLVFADATNGVETYGGGRFLYTGPPDAAGRVVVDFNMAYNPPCVFSPFATCPLPWPANRLPVRLEAGEMLPANAAEY